MTKSTVPENAEHSPVNKGAAETFRPVACQCADATGRVPSLREAEAADGPDTSSHPETPRASLLPQSACASQEAPRPRPPLPVLQPGCSTGHSQARQHASAKTRPSPAVLRPWGWTGALRRGGDPRSLSALGWQSAWGEAHLLLFLAGSSLTSPLFSARVGKSPPGTLVSGEPQIR